MQVVQNQNIQKPNAGSQQNISPTTQPCTQCQGYVPSPVPYYSPSYSQPMPQNVQIPATSAGVNIQIFNPSAGSPGGSAPTYNVNAPCYPSDYYTHSLTPGGKMVPNMPTTQSLTPTDSSNTVKMETDRTTNIHSDKKMEKRKIVELNDNYIMMLEKSLDSQDEKVRINAAKNVYSRLEEDDSRHDDKALTALINKMLQDPCDEVRLLALTALEGRIVDGDDYTVNVLKNMQKSNGGYGQDAIDATNILLQMSARQVDKEFEVKDKSKEEKKDDVKFEPTVKTA